MNNAVSRETLSIRRVTDRGLLVTGCDTDVLYRHLRKAAMAGVVEVVLADGNLLLVLEPGVPPPRELFEMLKRIKAGQASEETPQSGPVLMLPVVFDGMDLTDVAARADLTPAGLVERLCATELRVKFMGFQPGFAYLEGLPPVLHLPRLDTPRTRVPKGGVALGGAYCGIYPAEGPGGWRLVGRTEIPLFNPEFRQPALFAPGRRVRLVTV